MNIIKIFTISTYSLRKRDVSKVILLLFFEILLTYSLKTPLYNSLNPSLLKFQVNIVNN